MINPVILNSTGLILGIVFGVLAFIIFGIVISHIKIVKETDEFVIERLGKYTTFKHAMRSIWEIG